MTSPEVLIALDAPRIANYTVDGDGHGYVSLRIHEWTFFYTKDSAPTTPTTPATPSTPDTSNPPTTGAQTPGTTTPPSSSQQNPTSTSRVSPQSNAPKFPGDPGNAHPAAQNENLPQAGDESVRFMGMSFAAGLAILAVAALRWTRRRN